MLLLSLLAADLVPEDPHHQLRAVLRRAGVHRPDHELQLGEHPLGQVGVVADAVQHADALAVESHVLREGLAHEELEAHCEEEAHGEGVLARAI